MRRGAVTASYFTWLLTRLTELRRDRRRAQYAKYTRTPKGRTRDARYKNTIGGQVAQRKSGLRCRAGRHEEMLARLAAAQVA